MAAKRYRIAIVGSYDPSRVDELKLEKHELAPQAGEELGQALAKKGFNIITYASYPYLLELDVVRGYTKIVEDEPDCIEVRYPSKLQQPAYAEAKVDDPRFRFIADRNTNWEVSFYQSIAQIDGMLLLGGGRSALIAGIVAISHRKPIVACKCFGGEAKNVWEALANRNILATDEEVDRMAYSWTPTSAEKMVELLEAQIRRVEDQKSEQLAADKARIELALATQSKSKRQSYMYLLIQFSAIVFAFGVYFIVLNNLAFANQFWQLLMLISSALTGIAGASTTVIFDRRRKPRGNHYDDPLWTAGFGAVAGLISSGLFVIAQTFANPVNSSGTTQVVLYDRLFLFTMLIGLIAGLTFEPVLKRLRTLDVVQTGGIPGNDSASQ